jgi:hypothetical protein
MLTVVDRNNSDTVSWKKRHLPAMTLSMRRWKIKEKVFFIRFAKSASIYQLGV